MSFEVAMTAEMGDKARQHLLHYFEQDIYQEDLCFALWRPSTGNKRRTGLVYEIILPQNGERELHGNASFQPEYIARSIELACEKKAGLALMHSHPGRGWQDMSEADVRAERDVLAYPALSTDLPLIGLTIGATDGYWSARFWEMIKGKMTRQRCEKVRVVGTEFFKVYFDDKIAPPPERREILRRTIDTWGNEAQQNIARLRVGIVGLGSVGCIVAEALARTGISRITLIDHDVVQEHNLDRLIYATERDIGRRKVDLAGQKIRRHTTAKNTDILALPMSIRNSIAYKAAIDCDILFSCVDRPVGRDVLNYIAYAHCIPVIDGGVDVGPVNHKLQFAHWRAHLIGPQFQCMRCIRQYTSSDVSTELDGSLDSPSYIANLPPEERMNNQNVFSFSLSVAAMELNLMFRYLLAEDGWPISQQHDQHFLTGDITITDGTCHPSCEFLKRVAIGDSEKPCYLVDDTRADGISSKLGVRAFLRKMRKFLHRR